MQDRVGDGAGGGQRRRGEFGDRRLAEAAYDPGRAPVCDGAAGPGEELPAEREERRLPVRGAEPAHAEAEHELLQPPRMFGIGEHGLRAGVRGAAGPQVELLRAADGDRPAAGVGGALVKAPAAAVGEDAYRRIVGEAVLPQVALDLPRWGVRPARARLVEIRVERLFLDDEPRRQVVFFRVADRGRPHDAVRVVPAVAHMAARMPGRVAERRENRRDQPVLGIGLRHAPGGAERGGAGLEYPGDSRRLLGEPGHGRLCRRAARGPGGRSRGLASGGPKTIAPNRSLALRAGEAGLDPRDAVHVGRRVHAFGGVTADLLHRDAAQRVVPPGQADGVGLDRLVAAGERH